VKGDPTPTLNGLYTPFGSPVSRGTETQVEGERKKGEKVMEEINLHLSSINLHPYS
jgi:hypothetical protein